MLKTLGVTSADGPQKIVVMLVCFVLEFIVSATVGSFIFGSLQWILVIWLVLMALSVDKFLLSVPEITGLLTVDVFTGALRPYGTGFHLRYPWEQVKAGNYINLRIITEPIEESYPAQDGPSMLTKWSFQYRPRLDMLARYISVDDRTIKEGLKDVGSSILSANIAQVPAADCKKNQQQVEEELKKEFQDLHPTPAELYGIDLIRVSLADVDYEPTVQAVRASEQVAARLRAIAAAIRTENPAISQKDAMNLALIIHGNIKKDVVEVEGEGGNALAALLIAASRGGNHGRS